MMLMTDEFINYFTSKNENKLVLLSGLLVIEVTKKISSMSTSEVSSILNVEYYKELLNDLTLINSKLNELGSDIIEIDSTNCTLSSISTKEIIGILMDIQSSILNRLSSVSKVSNIKEPVGDFSFLGDSFNDNSNESVKGITKDLLKEVETEVREKTNRIEAENNLYRATTEQVRNGKEDREVSFGMSKSSKFDEVFKLGEVLSEDNTTNDLSKEYDVSDLLGTGTYTSIPRNISTIDDLYTVLDDLAIKPSIGKLVRDDEYSVVFGQGLHHEAIDGLTYREWFNNGKPITNRDVELLDMDFVRIKYLRIKSQYLFNEDDWRYLIDTFQLLWNNAGNGLSKEDGDLLITCGNFLQTSIVQYKCMSGFNDYRQFECSWFSNPFNTASFELD